MNSYLLLPSNMKQVRCVSIGTHTIHNNNPLVMDNNCVKYHPNLSNLDLEDMTFGQGHDTPLDPGQPLCIILSRSIRIMA